MKNFLVFCDVDVVAVIAENIQQIDYGRVDIYVQRNEGQNSLLHHRLAIANVGIVIGVVGSAGRFGGELPSKYCAAVSQHFQEPPRHPGSSNCKSGLFSARREV